MVVVGISVDQLGLVLTEEWPPVYTAILDYKRKRVEFEIVIRSAIRSVV